MKWFKKMCWLILIIIVSCNSDFNNEKKRMIKGLSKTYIIDTTKGDYYILKNVGVIKLELILSENGTFKFSPYYCVLNGYDGTWSLSDDDEFSSFIFNCKNGNKEENRTLFIDINYKGKECRLYFEDQIKPSIKTGL